MRDTKSFESSLISRKEGVVFYCLMSAGRPLPTEVSDLLLEAAFCMRYTRKDHVELDVEYVKGAVTTEGRSACFGSISGTIFYAKVNTIGGGDRSEFHR